MLRHLGHAVDVAEHGKQAVEMFRQAREAGVPYDLVLLDLTVRGGMGGAGTAGALRAIDPDVRVAVASGYSDEMATIESRSEKFAAFIKKPFDMEGLRACAASALSGPQWRERTGTHSGWQGVPLRGSKPSYHVVVRSAAHRAARASSGMRTRFLSLRPMEIRGGPRSVT